MKNVFLFLWQLPQNLLGLLVVHITKAKKTEWNGIVWYKTDWRIGVSLGNYIILYKFSDLDDIRHEYGHQIQSLFLGWLYLVIVGIPSAVFNNLWDRIFHKKWNVDDRYDWYYARFPENWADGLGGVNRYKE